MESLNACYIILIIVSICFWISVVGLSMMCYKIRKPDRKIRKREYSQKEISNLKDE